MQPKPSQRMYSSVYLALTQLLPQEVDSRLTNMAFLMIGIFGAHSVQTGKLAASIPLHIKDQPRPLQHPSATCPVELWAEFAACGRARQLSRRL